MKWLLRIVLGLAALALLALLAVWLLLPRLLDDAAVRERITQAARESLGRDLSYERLELGFLPPSLRALGTQLSGESADAEPLLEAREISLRVSLWPLLFGGVVVDSLVIDGATVRLTRTDRGIALPEPPDTASTPGSGGPAGAGEPGSGGDADEGGGFALAVREVSLRDSTLWLDDRAVRPAVSWEIREIDAQARGTSLDAPIDLDLSASLASGGDIGVKGTASTAGALDLSLRLDDLSLAPLAPYVGGEIQELAGRVGGTATLRGPAGAPERLTADLTGRDVRLRREDLAVSGPVALKLDLAHPLGGGTADGSFDLEATDAKLAMGGGFTKPPGTPARVTGRIVPAAGGGLGIDDLKLVIKNFEATGRVSSLDPVKAELRAEPFELAGWGEILPALAASQPEGRLSLPELRYTGRPQALNGSVRLDGVSLKSESGAPPLVLEGLLRAEGDRLRSEGLRARTADQAFDLDARVDSLFETPRYEFDVKASEADSNVLMSTLLSKPDTLFGPLGLDASFRGQVGDDVLGSLDGRIDFGIVDGRLVGVSLLRSVTERLGQVGNLALNLGKAFGGRDLQRFYGDEFERMEGVLDLSDGVARTEEDLRLVYRGYTVSLRGKLDLRDLALDMTGQLTIGPEIDEKLARELRLPDTYAPRSRVLPLTAVRGTLGAPKVTLSPELPVSLAASYARESLGLGQAGEGTGSLEKAVGDLLQDALGGGSR